MNASASRIEYRNSEVIKKSKKPANIIPPPSTTVQSLKSDTPRPETAASTSKLFKDEQNGHPLKSSKVVYDKRKSNGHPPSKPGTSAMTAEMKVPPKRRKLETTPQKAACPIDLIMDEMNNLESQKRKAKKKGTYKPKHTCRSNSHIFQKKAIRNL